MLQAWIVVRVLTATARAIVSPDAAQLRLLPVGTSAAFGIITWVRRLAAVAAFGTAFADVALLFGLYRVAHDALLRLVALAFCSLLALIVLRHRAAAARLIRHGADGPSTWETARRLLAAAWHIPALALIVGFWVVWAFELENGLPRLIRAVVVSGIVVVAARIAVVSLRAALDRAIPTGPPAGIAAAATTGWIARILPYRGALVWLLNTTAGLLAVAALLFAWGWDVPSWFEAGTLGARIAGAAASIALTLAVAFGAWEAANIGVRRHLARLTAEAQTARSARLLTLLPMLRTALLIAIGLFAGLTVLGEIGVNIAPLLAGAGVVGIAIGFGSQKLVQDVITGLFLLLENAMQVGDVVTLGGLSGTVEALSIRAIRLRALDGAVHIVPFSAVTTVTNQTRDFSFALLDISVGLNEEPEPVIAAVREVTQIMRREPRWETAIRDDLEVMGVERFVDLAWVLRIRLRTAPAQRWAVARELNRRIKQIFDDRAIESPITSHRVLSGPPPLINAGTVEAGPVTSPP